ncbi:hypothetical protein [Leifsonia sp. AG29]|uniref:hypothetical protein n=1 Tax=Leifsonia sp. AG29 TaxID=2598860 RepID=UPI00131AD5AD|nr:hypothetical protein [Leifsonia sp. AG29]
MPWWSWLLIWSVLVLGLLGMLAFFAWWLFRKVVAAGRDAADLLAKTEVLGRHADELSEEPFHPAVFADLAELHEQRSERLAERAVARQARRDARVRRGKLLVQADPNRYAHLIRRT